MRTTAVVLAGLAVLIAPVAPSLAQDGGRAPSGGAAPAFEGEHWALEADPGLPGARNLTLSQSNATVARAVELPGDRLAWEFDDDRAELSTEAARLRVEDRADLRLRLRADDSGPARLHLAEGVTVRNASGGAARLHVPDGPDLVLAGDGLSVGEGEVVVGPEGQLGLARAEQASDDDADDREGPSGNASGNGSEDANRSEDPTRRPEDPDRRDDRRNESRENGSDRRDGERGARGGPPASGSRAAYRLGPVQFDRDNDTLHDVRLRNTTLFSSVGVPGLTPAEERRRGAELRLDGESARVEVEAAGGLWARLEAEQGLRARLGPDVEVQPHENGLVLAADSLLVVVEGDGIEIDDRILEADELRINARARDRAPNPVWERDPAPAGGLPHDHEGRYASFRLEADGLRNLTVHGTPIGDVRFDEASLEELRHTGARLHAEGPGLALRVEDVPALQLRLEADGLAADVPARTTLPSGARVTTSADGDELRVRVDRPDEALANRTPVEHEPPTEAVERTEGPSPGLRAPTADGELGVTSADPATLAAHFAGRLNGTQGNVSVELGLVRAMLVDDTNGNGRVDVGEPAVAERPLANGTVAVEGEALVSRFPLWSGNLTVTTEPGNATAKVTYEAHDLDAPPGTLFVLETRVQAPPDARLEPTETGVTVRNGTVSASFSAAGPVTVDGSQAWAQRSIFVDSSDQVRVLLAYPAGDDIVHDPTLAIQSTGAAQVAEALAASPYAILVGAGLAGLLVAGTVAVRRRRRPERPG